MEASIVLRQIVKTFGARKVLDGVSLEVGKGEFFSLLGPSGAGKTTVLRLCAGFEHPDAGQLTIDGRSMEGVPPNERSVNTVFQSYALFPHLSVEANVGFGLTMRRVAPVERDRRVGEALALLHMEHLRRRVPGQLSGGEQQRVAIARALVNRPSVVLLDEPMAALDEPLRQAMLAELTVIQRQLGTTFLCVTHHQDEALAISDRVAVMHEGRIVQIGTPRELYETPATRFVAEFIGRSNFLEGRVVERGEGSPGLLVNGIDDLVPIHASTVAQHPLGSVLTLVVRAEVLRLNVAPTLSPERACLPVRVEARRYGGPVWHYLLRLPSGQPWRATIPSDGPSTEQPEPGTEVFASWPRDRMKVVVA